MWSRRLPKSIKIVTTCDGHVEGMKKETMNHQLLVKIKQNSSDRKCMVFHVQLLMQNIWLSRLHTRSKALFYEMIICTIFISVNRIHTFLWREFILSFIAMTEEIKSLCL